MELLLIIPWTSAGISGLSNNMKDYVIRVS